MIIEDDGCLDCGEVCPKARLSSNGAPGVIFLWSALAAEYSRLASRGFFVLVCGMILGVIGVLCFSFFYVLAFMLFLHLCYSFVFIIYPMGTNRLTPQNAYSVLFVPFIKL